MAELLAAEAAKLNAQLGGAVAAAVSRHGDTPRWQAALDALPTSADAALLDADAITLTGACGPDTLQALQALRPWRKGPFELFGHYIDSEWRSNLKWDRLAASGIGIAGRRVIDIGCGNFYYGWRLLGAGAGQVVGVDPSVLFASQYLALRRCLPHARATFVTLPSQQLTPDGSYDVALSMGVLYHRRDPLEHLRELRDWLQPGGVLALETLVIDGDASAVLTPPDRYARMRNVWLIPSVAALTVWLTRSGFGDVQCLDQAITGSDEQRSTQWMPFESLADALAPHDPTRTVEGHPAPRRALLLARR